MSYADIVLSIAHDLEHGDPGAVCGGLKDAELSCIITRAVIDELCPLDGGSVSTKVLDGSLREAIERTNDLKPYCAVEFHFDAGGGSEGMALIAPGLGNTSDSYTIAQRLAACITAITPWSAKVRPAQPPYIARPRLAWVEDTTCPAVLVECGFIDNPVHAAWLADERNLYSLGTAFGLALDSWLHERKKQLPPTDAATVTDPTGGSSIRG